MRLIATGLLLFFSLNTTAALAQSDPWLSPHGQAFTNLYRPIPGTGLSKSLLQQAQGLQVEATKPFGEEHSFSFNGQLIYYSATANPDMDRLQFDFREGYYQLRHKGWDFRAGRQIISWGKADVITPTDFLVGTDYRRFTPTPETRKLGSDGFLLSYTPNDGDSPWNLTGVWNLDFARSTLLLPPNSPALNVDLRDPAKPPVTFENSEFALKGSYIQSGWDASLSYFNGWNHLPELTKGAVYGLQPLVTVQPTFTRIRALGADGSYSFEKWVARIEGAYTWTQNEGARTAMYQPPHADAVLGLERPFGEKWRLQLQGLARYFPDYRDPNSETGIGPVDTAVNQAIARSNALVQGYERSWKAGATARVSYGSPEADWNPELFVISYPATDELMIRPRLLYRVTQSLQLDLGLERYFGPTNSVIGRFEPYSSYFAEARWIF